MNGLLFVRRQLSEVQVGGIPYFHVLRMKSLQRDGAIDKLPHGSNVPSSTARQRLNHNITDSRSLRVTGDDGNAHRISSPLVQQVVTASTTYDVQYLYRAGRKVAQIIQHLAIAQGKTFEDATYHLSPCPGDRLAMVGAISQNGLIHISRIAKLSVIRNYQTAKRLTGLHLGNK